ncbi:hypothetical protein LLB_1113 [Legionella longbeachae D-4968]|nr:hypothetical protein LLB_1113 [Legionella longbeachae D-4968]
MNFIDSLAISMKKKLKSMILLCLEAGEEQQKIILTDN